MLKNILNLDGAQQLSNDEQKSIKGGLPQYCVQMIHIDQTCDATMNAATCAANEGIYVPVCRCCNF